MSLFENLLKTFAEAGFTSMFAAEANCSLAVAQLESPWEACVTFLCLSLVLSSFAVNECACV